ncbi:hypothetical protein ACVTMO_02445 [Pseudomonas segetis]
MTTPSQWKYSAVDVYAKRYGIVAQEFLALVVAPSLDALDHRFEALRISGEAVKIAFESPDHIDLFDKTCMSFCLAIQSLWERQLRTYLGRCPNAFHVEGVTRDKLEKAVWGTDNDHIGGLFRRIRGLELDAFDSYPVLNKLQLLGNACRHGDGPSGRKLYKHHPELWPPLAWSVPGSVSAAPSPLVDHIDISREHLTEFVNAIDVFWVDMECHGLESFGSDDPYVQQQIETLREARTPKLLTFRPDLVG